MSQESLPPKSLTTNSGAPVDSEQRERLFGNIARHMQAGNSSEEIQLRQICHFFRADPAYGIGVANALGIDIDQFIPNGAAQPEALVGKH